MRLQGFSVRDYRSIRDATRIQVRSDLTVLVGPNNEGKTNLLRALDLAFGALEDIAFSHKRNRLILEQTKGNSRVRIRTSFRRPVRTTYEWHRDYPSDQQMRRLNVETTIRLTFVLSKGDRTAFCDQVGHRISDLLPIELSFGPDAIHFRVPKQRWSRELTSQAGAISAFVQERVRFAFIPAVRTHRHASSVVDEILASRLAQLEQQEDYCHALQTIEELQSPVLQQLSQELTLTLKQFLPAVSEVRVGVSREQRYERMRSASEVLVNDGVETPLSSKGDGVISLAAICLMKQAAASRKTEHLLLAIEEPEAHLHPRGVHLLRDVLHDLAASQQVLLTTHSPLFADRRTPASNVIVENNRARGARSIREVRESLGVRAADNLMHAEVVLLVEGPNDRTAIGALLRHHSPLLAAALDKGSLAIQPIDGCSKLASAVYSLEHAVVQWHCLLDFDKEGRDAMKKIVDEGAALPRMATFTTLGKKRECELEDWFATSIYEADFDAKYGAILQSAGFTQARGKWSKRMKAAFDAKGLDWESRALDAKATVAAAVNCAPADALRRDALMPFTALAERLKTALR